MMDIHNVGRGSNPTGTGRFAAFPATCAGSKGTNLNCGQEQGALRKTGTKAVPAYAPGRIVSYLPTGYSGKRPARAGAEAILAGCTPGDREEGEEKSAPDPQYRLLQVASAAGECLIVQSAAKDVLSTS
jgi:hypothetical protein